MYIYSYTQTYIYPLIHMYVINVYLCTCIYAIIVCLLLFNHYFVCVFTFKLKNSFFRLKETRSQALFNYKLR